MGREDQGVLAHVLETRVVEISEIYTRHFQTLYASAEPTVFSQICSVVCTEARQITEDFLEELRGERGAERYLGDEAVSKRLVDALSNWTRNLFKRRNLEETREFVRRQLHIGQVHATQNVPTHLFEQAIRHLKRELSERLVASRIPRAQLSSVLEKMNEMVDLSGSLMMESVFNALRAAERQHQLSHALKRTLAVVLAGGRGSRLGALTHGRAKPALRFGGKFRVIDFPLSNCVNSGIHRIGVLTQYEAHELIRHVQHGWSFLRSKLNEFVEVWPAQQQVDSNAWYSGTADAVLQNLEMIRAQGPEYVLILAGDHVYRQDYSRMLAQLLEQEARAVVSCLEVPLEQATAFGVMTINENGTVIDFFEKPRQPNPIPGQPDQALASMGIYLFEAEFLFDVLERDAKDPTSSHDFGRDILPALVEKRGLIAHRFGESCVLNQAVTGYYWRDVGTVDAFWEASMDLIAVTPELDLYDTDWPIWTLQESLPPAKFVFQTEGRQGAAFDSLVSAGCIISGGMVFRSVLGTSVRVNSYSLVEDSVLMAHASVGRRCRLRRVILDSHCFVPEGLVIGEDPKADAERFHLTEGGVTVVTKAMLERLL